MLVYSVSLSGDLHKIFGPSLVVDDFRIRWNIELYEVLNEVDAEEHVNILHWLYHFVRKDEDAPVKRVGAAGDAEVGEEDDLACIGNRNRRKTCRQLV